MRSLRAFSVGGSAPNPPGFTAFFRQNGLFLLCFKGTGSTCPPAFPAAESVARVASQHCPIPSGSGRLSINHPVGYLNEKLANGDYPLNFVSQVLGSSQNSVRPPLLHAQLVTTKESQNRIDRIRPVRMCGAPVQQQKLCAKNNRALLYFGTRLS